MAICRIVRKKLVNGQSDISTFSSEELKDNKRMKAFMKDAIIINITVLTDYSGAQMSAESHRAGYSFYKAKRILGERKGYKTIWP